MPIFTESATSQDYAQDYLKITQPLLKLSDFSFDRFISVHDALHVHLIMTVKNCLILVVTCWVAALLLAIFPYLIPDRGMMGAEARPYKIKNYEYMPSLTQVRKV